jgi:hypothetical protein
VRTANRATPITTAVRQEAIAWCARLARDRAQPAWSIRFTRDDIESSPSTQLAWRTHLAVKEQLGRDAPPHAIWAEAERRLRAAMPPPRPAPAQARPRPPSVPATPRSPRPPRPPRPPRIAAKKEKQPVAKKQTRRSISVSRTVYERAKTFAETKGVPLSQLTAVALAHAVEHFYRDGATPATTPDRSTTRRKTA